MAYYLVSNIVGRNHQKIYEELGKSAFFDLSPHQSGWDEFSKIQAGDLVYVINENGRVAVGHSVNRVMAGILLAEDPTWGSRVASAVGGNVGVIFGKVCERVDMEYSKFVRQRGIRSSKLNPATGQMYQGFNCASFR
ncbi:hypothetical protein [Solimonas sp. SE-A11]|uniref:hypothetical protein n=1 Tax=Solimonas sp. SE-A11 TaxID=3054954 RepID=UPI00259D00EC|nr:hypothetical protein [Solimonas sp. SE-A11]MDM4772426.1 hypothetical protein [Solimonas sp. SE-A11]